MQTKQLCLFIPLVMVKNKQTNGCWVWIMRGKGLFPTFLILYIYPCLFSENK